MNYSVISKLNLWLICKLNITAYITQKINILIHKQILYNKQLKLAIVKIKILNLNYFIIWWIKWIFIVLYIFMFYLFYCFQGCFITDSKVFYTWFIA